MNVQIENLPNCITTLRVELPADTVKKTWEDVASEYTKFAKLPGYRPGKAPRAIVEGKFRKEIRDEVQSRSVSDSLRGAVKEHNLRYLAVQNLEEVEFADDKSLSFTVTLVTAPSFDLPEYKGIAVELPSAAVTDEEIDAALERLRIQQSEFTDVTDRAVEAADYAVISYAGTLDGKPLDEAIEGVAKRFVGNDDFWIKLDGDNFLPGFGEKLVGAKIDETREFDIELPADYSVEELAGKTIHYSATLKGIKSQVLPELNDEFAGKIVEGKTLAELRDLARTELGRQKEFEFEQEKRNQILLSLVTDLECELPESHVKYETNRILNDLIQENLSRGLTEDAIREGRDELLASAAEAARERLKATFILLQIGEKENISVLREEFESRIAMMATRYRTTPEKLRKDLEKANALEKIHEEVLTGKVLDFLVANASVSEKAAEAPAAEAAEAEKAS